MNKNDYTSSVLKSITNKQKQNIIKAELDDHICENTSFFQKIGYTADIAEEKAVEAMGDTAPVAEQFGNIHNKKTDIFKDFGLGILICIISLFPASVFGSGTIEAYICCILLKAVCILLLLYTLSYTALKRNSKTLTIFSYALCIFWIIYSGKMLLTSAEYIEAYMENIRIAADILILIIFNLPIIINNLFAYSYKKKVKALCNTGKDLRKKNNLLKFSNIVIIVLSVSAAVLLFTFIGIIINTTKQTQNELSSSIQTTLELSEKIKADTVNIEEVLNNEKIKYTKEYNEYDDSSVTRYEYASNSKYIYSDITYYDYYENYEFTEDEDEGRLSISTASKNNNSYIGLWPGFFSMHYIKTPNEYREEVLTVNNEKYIYQNKEDIINTFVSYNPSSLTISYSEYGITYTFSYAVNFETYYTSLEFDNDGNIISANTKIESW